MYSLSITSTATPIALILLWYLVLLLLSSTFSYTIFSTSNNHHYQYHNKGQQQQVQQQLQFQIPITKGFRFTNSHSCIMYSKANDESYDDTEELPHLLKSKSDIYPSFSFDGNNRKERKVVNFSRKKHLMSNLLIPLSFAGMGILLPRNSNALVKGNAPPPDLKSKNSAKIDRPKTRNMEDAMEIGKQREQELENSIEEYGEGEILSTPEGDRYRDLIVGTGGNNNNNDNNNNNIKNQIASSQSAILEINGASECSIRYRALRLGKRSRDGLSGEATTIFSYGK